MPAYLLQSIFVASNICGNNYLRRCFRLAIHIACTIYCLHYLLLALFIVCIIYFLQQIRIAINICGKGILKSKLLEAKRLDWLYTSLYAAVCHRPNPFLLYGRAVILPVISNY
jgi:hypothetical protein